MLRIEVHTYVPIHEDCAAHLILDVAGNVGHEESVDLHGHLRFVAPSVRCRPGSHRHVVRVEDQVNNSIDERGVIDGNLDCLNIQNIYRVIIIYEY